MSERKSYLQKKRNTTLGVVDEVRVYNRSLGGTEILALARRTNRSIAYRYDRAGMRMLKTDSEGVTRHYFLDAGGRTRLRRYDRLRRTDLPSFASANSGGWARLGPYDRLRRADTLAVQENTTMRFYNEMGSNVCE